MTFKHKLSVRLALMHDIVLAVAAEVEKGCNGWRIPPLAQSTPNAV